MNSQTLKSFKRWYTVVVMLIIVAFLVAAYLNYGKPSAYLYGCFAVLSGLMLVVTNFVVRQLLPKEKHNKFRNK